MSSVVSHLSVSRRATALSSVTGLLVLLAASPAATQPTFTQICYGTNLSHGIAVADFDNDGDQDVALNPGQASGQVFTFSNEIHIFLGNGDGTFASAGQDSAAGAYMDLFAVDVDNDGDQDLVAGGNPASVLRGNGDGTFQAPEPYATTNISFSVAIGDLNGDGFTDLVASDDDRNITVRLNQGDGTFGGVVDRSRPGEQVRTMITTDMNGDGDLDVVALLEGTFRVRVLLGKGDGSLRNPIKTDLSGNPGRDLAPADFNGDGNMDLAVAAYNGQGLVFLPGNGNGKFGSPTSYPMAGNTTRLDVGDFDGDGNDDIVAANFFASPTGGNVSILYGNGVGAFTIGTVVPVAFGNGVVAAYLNGDSNLDLVVDWCALLNNGGVAFAAAAVAPALSQPTVTAAPARLSAAFSPNPLQRQGTLGFVLPRGGKVSIHLYDVRGRLVHTLMDRAWLEAGNHEVGIDRRAAGLGAGMYFYRIEALDTRKTGSIVMLDR